LITKKLLSIFLNKIFVKGEKNTKVIYCTLILLLIFSACSDEMLLTDVNRSMLNSYGEIKRDTLYAIAARTYSGGKVNTGSSSKLLLGSYGGYNAQFLMKFTNLPNDTIVVDTVRLLLRVRSNMGDSTSMVNGTIYRVTSSWGNDVNIDSSWDVRSNLDYSAATSLNFSISSADSATLVFDLPVGLVDIWRDTVTAGQQNFGLFFDYQSAEQIIQFYSLENSTVDVLPRLVFIYKDTSTDTGGIVYDTTYASLDASLIDFDGNLDQNTIYIGAGYSIYSFVQFDLSVVPSDAFVSTANFVFNQDVDRSVLDPKDSQMIYLRDVTTAFDELPYFQLDSTFNLSTYYNLILREITTDQLSLDDKKKAVAGQKFMQNIINGEIACGSFYLEHVFEEESVGLYAIKGIQTAVPDVRPYLVIEYFLSPPSRL
jgi:hypothetical protein